MITLNRIVRLQRLTAKLASALEISQRMKITGDYPLGEARYPAVEARTRGMAARSAGSSDAAHRT